MDESLSTLWAKNPEKGADAYPLLAHLLDTYVVSLAVWDVWLTPRMRDVFADLLTTDADGSVAFRRAKARKLVGLAAALHDVGKANPVFQFQQGDGRDLAWRNGILEAAADVGLNPVDSTTAYNLQANSTELSRRHEFISYLATAGTDSVNMSSRNLLAESWLPTSVGGHHGRWKQPTALTSDIAPSLVSGEWGTAQQSIIDKVCAAVGADVVDLGRIERGDAGVAVVLVTGMVILADWVASGETVVQAGQALRSSGTDPNDATSWVDRRLVELREHTARTIGSYSAPSDPVSSVLQGHSPRPLQRDVMDTPDTEGLWMVAYPTGEGKTEAALLRHMSRDDEGIIFGLPTRATTNAMHKRLEKTFGGTGNHVQLSHQFATNKGGETSSASACCMSPSYGEEWFTDGIRRLVAPVSTATCDQIFMGALSQSHIALRLLALSNHHIVLDEVHTYDHYQSELPKELLAWWGRTRTRVTLLSATLPIWQQREFENAYRTGLGVDDAEAIEPVYPSHRFVSDDSEGVAKTTPLSSKTTALIPVVNESPDGNRAHVEWATTARSTNPNCHIAVVVNTVDSSIKVAEQVQAAMPGVEVVCLHSRMTQEHRTSIENLLHERLGKDAVAAAPIIVVATSVIEASLDLDFDLMSTDVAPASSIIQRTGRLWRFHDSTQRAARFGYEPTSREVHVVVRAPRQVAMTYAAALPFPAKEMERVRAELTARTSIRVPEDVQGFVDEAAFDLRDYWSMVASDATDHSELAGVLSRIRGSDQSRAPLTQVLLTSDCPTYDDLCKITTRNDAESAMRTRYIDMPGGTYVLVDSRPGQATHTLPTSAERLANLAVPNAISALEFTVPASGKANDEMLRLHHETMRRAGMDEWRPRSKMLFGILPVEMELLERSGFISYDEQGLRRL